MKNSLNKEEGPKGPIELKSDDKKSKKGKNKQGNNNKLNNNNKLKTNNLLRKKRNRDTIINNKNSRTNIRTRDNNNNSNKLRILENSDF